MNVTELPPPGKYPGSASGIETPFMKTVVDIVTKLEEGQLNVSHAWENLKYFDIPELG